MLTLATVTPAGIGTAQVMTFALPLAVFSAVVIAMLLGGRSGHARRIQDPVEGEKRRLED
jgi:hypothetical protein